MKVYIVVGYDAEGRSYISNVFSGYKAAYKYASRFEDSRLLKYYMGVHARIEEWEVRRGIYYDK